ncbi:hypothetical protein BUALT_Bualt19G0081600 [Buddleja alternifolia]|uniref:Glutathione transferase n=1 Tax=Buddleja alternifolia TaxID=168488 RepID=A0AAV6W2N4_9LAMI|nr:hypothetical protein BUALT_Bualt19G0081600 [Buddleja alternifolia]
MASDGGGAVSTKLKLYSYWRSSCSCRVRIALNLKGLDYEYVSINLLKGEQKSPEFLKLNPLGYVPVLVDGETYLEEKYPQHPLLPRDLQKMALNYQVANIVAANIQPYQNIPIIGYIKEKLGPEEMLAWVQHHIRKGFTASWKSFNVKVMEIMEGVAAHGLERWKTLEKLLENHAGKYATGDEAFLGDFFLAPQIDVAVKRFSVDMNEFPSLAKINESYGEHPAFQEAMPGKQPDTPPEARD